jgi:hypothetical protein
VLRKISLRSPTRRVPSAESGCAQIGVGLLTLLPSSFQSRYRLPLATATQSELFSFLRAV